MINSAKWVLRNIFLLASISVTSLGLIACNGSEDTANAGIIGDGTFNKIVKNAATNNNIPAITVIVTENGEVIESATVGKRSFAKPVSATERDQWQLGSVTKAITATLAARLIELGYLRWDSTIEESFPEYTDQIHADFHTVTITELLQHRSGLIRHVDANGHEKSNLDRLGYALRTLKNSAKFNRGEHHYSNVGYTIAGLMLGRATNLSWEEALDTYLFSPLNITKFGFGFPDPKEQLEQPIGHLRRSDHSGDRVNDYWIPVHPNDDPFREPLLIMGPAGGVFLPKHEYIKFQHLHLAGANNETDFLSSDSFNRLQVPPVGGDYAMGWETTGKSFLDRVKLPSDELVLMHSGSVGSWSSLSIILPKRDISIFLASNSSTPSTNHAYLDDLLKIIFERLQITE